MTTKSLLRLVAAAGAMAASAQAGEAEDLAALKEEIADLRSEYDAKIEALEARLKAAEEKPAPAVVAAPPPPPAVEPAPAPAPVVAETAPTSNSGPVPANVYNPGVSVVLNGTFAAYENDPDLAVIPGFPLDEEAGLTPEGFSLGESELAINANIDHRLYGNLIFALTGENEVEIEEAYLQTTSLPGGFTLKGGRFFSGVGYLNEKHAHFWDFADAPLPYRAFLGVQYGDDGIQLKWVAPTDFYLEAGGEWFRGDSFPAAGADNHGKGTAAGYIVTGGDIGVSSSWLAKFSYLRAKADGRETEAGDLFSGVDNLGIASVVYKWAPQGNPKRRNLIVNGEYFFGSEKGEFNGMPINMDRWGWYGQAVYQFRPRTRVGLRYARISADDPPLALADSAIDVLGRRPSATSALLEYDTSEFSRFRLMYTFDDSDLLSNSEFFAVYTVTFGPHGAHRF